MHLTDLVLPGMRAPRWRRVIASTFSGVAVPIAKMGVSNTLRAASIDWPKTLAREMAPDCITVKTVLPGRIATDRIGRLDEARAAREGKSIDEVVRESTTAIPVGRIGCLEEYTDVVVFIVSCRSSYFTG